LWSFYNEKGLLKSTYFYFNDKKNGCAKMFDSTGTTVIEEVFYLNDTLQNESTTYYLTGEIKSLSNYLNGKKVGTVLEFNKNGEIITELIYDDGYLKSKQKINRYNKQGKKEGYWREFYPSGQLKSELNYKDGVKTGIVKNYSEKGKIKSIKKYSVDTTKLVEDIELIEMYRENYSYTVKKRLIGGLYHNMKEGMFREYDTTGQVINGYLYKNDTIIAEGIILDNGIYNGVWKYYYSTGELKSKGDYINGSKNNLWIYYFKNGQIQQKGKYKNEQPTGEWKWYYQNGQLRRVEYYRKNKLEGTQIEYDRQGNEITHGEYYNGLKEGKWFYHINGFKETGLFTMGYKTGQWKYYYNSNKLAFEGEFDEGQPKGKHVYYHQNGVKKKVGKYQIGEKHGYWKTYNNLGELTESLKYKRGKLIGINGQKIMNE